MSKKKTQAQKNARIIQSMVGVLCMAMLGFAFAWAIHITVQSFSVKTNPTPMKNPSSSQNSGDTSGSVPDTDESSADSDSSADTSKPDETDTSHEDTPDSAPSDDSTVMFFPAVDDIEDDFGDAVFIGNSRTVGLGMNCGKPLATFYASTGLNVDTIATSETITLDNGNKGTVYDALAQKQFKRVFIMFGINELGWPNYDSFETRYETLIEQVKKLQPGAAVYVQSELPVNYLAAGKDPVFTNANVDEINGYIKRAAEAQGAVYLDVNSALSQADGSLPLDAAPTDGIHLVKQYCLVWLQFLAQHT